MSEEKGGGTAGYCGFRYQVIASMWIALWLMLEARATTEVTVEPDCQDDLEAKLNEISLADGHVIEPLREEKRSTTVTLSSSTGGRMVFQMKERSTRAWTPASLRDVLDNGSPSTAVRATALSRTSAFAMLMEDPSMSYTLVTNANVNGDLKPLVAREIPVNHGAAALPPSAVPKGFTGRAEDVLGRVHILEQMVDQLLTHRIDALLVEHGDVPPIRAKACRKEIEEAFWLRMLPHHSRYFTLDDLKVILEKHGARTALGTVPGYVAPSKATIASEVLRLTRCLMLVGPPAVGKSQLAMHIAHCFSLDGHPLDVEYLASLTSLREHLRTKGTRLLVVENGWGHAAPGPAAEIVDLPTELALAPGDKYVIVTCDADLYDQLPPHMHTRLEASVVRINLEDYDDEARWQIVLDNAGLTGSQLESLLSAREAVLRELQTPATLNYLGALVQANAYRMRQPDVHSADDDWLQDDDLLPSVDPNINLFDELIERAIVETVGFDARQKILAFEPEAKRYAALLYAMDLSFPSDGLITDSKRPVSTALVNAIVSIKHATGQLLIMDHFVEYLHKNGLAEKQDDGCVWMSRITRDAIRDIVRETTSTVHPVVMGVTSELTKLLQFAWEKQDMKKFVDVIERIMRLVAACYKDENIPSSSWTGITETVQRLMELALTVAEGPGFSRIIETAMDWKWGQSPLCVIVRALNPSELPDPPTPADAYLPWVQSSTFWRNVFNDTDTEILHRFVRRFLTEFIPKTWLDYRGAEAKFASFLHSTGAVDHKNVRRALETMETHAMTDYGDDDDSNRLQNKAALVALLALVSPFPYQSVIPRPINDWEL